MYEAYQNNQQKNNAGCFQQHMEEFSTASSFREHEIQDVAHLNGFSIKVCGETIFQAQSAGSVTKNESKADKYAMSLEVSLPRQDDLPQPIFLLDD